jgi:hypothetical protein
MYKTTPRRRSGAKGAGRFLSKRGGRVFEVLEPRWTLSVGVSTYHNDIASSGLNAAEAVLMPATVNTASFAKLFATSLDGQVYAQPLVDPGVTIAAGPNTTAGAAGLHDIVLAATEHDSLYAIDASPTGTGSVLWQRSFLNIAAGYVGSTPGSNINNTLGATSITTVPSADVDSADISPEIGITSTPVIDPATGTIYVVVKSEETIGGVAHYVQRLHAINIADGTDAAAPFLIGDTSGGNTNNTQIYVYGDGDGAVVDPYNNTGNDVVQFNALREDQRSALSLVNNVVYVAWASHGDNGPYHGWVVGWNVSNLASGMTLAGVFNASPNGGEAGIWESGGGLVFEPDGSAFYFATGNGPLTHANPVLNSAGFPSDGSYYDAVVKLVADPTTTPTSQGVNGWGFKVADYFIPYNQVALDSHDVDLGSGGPLLLPDSAGIPGHPHLLVVGGKEGKLYLIDRDNMGKFNATNDNVVNAVPNGSGHNTPPVVFTNVFSTPAYYNGTIYDAGAFGSAAKAFTIASNGTLTVTSQTLATFGDKPGSVSISSNGAAAGVVWVMDRNANEIHAYDANNLGVELWNSGQRAGGADNLGSVVKFASPTVANGEVFVGTSNSLVVYGATSLLGSLTVASVVVVEATQQNGVLESNERGKITWAATAAHPIASATLTIDGSAVSPVNGPYGPSGGTFFFSALFGPLAAGTHTYVIQVVNNQGVVGGSSGTFVVTTAPPLISGVVVAEATRQDGILQANEKGVITWALTDGNPITSEALTVDGTAVSPILGPFGPSGSNLFYSATFDPLTAGSHSYTIEMTDNTGQSNSVSGTFTVAPVPTPVISLLVVAEATPQNGVLESNERLKITWEATSTGGIVSQTMTVDGRAIAPINGPYGGLYYSCPIGMWSAGDHTYVITATGSNGVSFSDSGTFTVVASAATPPSIASIVVAEAAAPTNGILEASDPLKITWAASSSDGIAAQTMMVDGRAIAPINGPYSGVYYSCPIGAWSAGTHTYAITSTDAGGISSTVSSTFNVAASSAVPVAIDGIVVAEASTARNGTLDSSEPLVITWAASSSGGIASQALTIDGRTVTPINGPYGGLYYSCQIGAWSAGTHTYVITASNSTGFTSNSSGTFTVVAAASMAGLEATIDPHGLLATEKRPPIAIAGL